MQIHQLFDAYLKKITPPDGELDAARSHRDLVQSRISLEGVTRFINSGSYIKRTALKPLDDIDLFVCFDGGSYEKDRKRVITRLAYHLNLSFPKKARTQRHSVGVQFSDVRVDVVPGFEVRSTKMFRIRNRIDGRWVETNIDLHKEFFRKRQVKDGRHRDLVMLAKAWNRKRRKRFGSYLIELLVTKSMAAGIPQGRDVAMHHFFSWVAKSATRQPVVFTDYLIAAAQN